MQTFCSYTITKHDGTIESKAFQRDASTPAPPEEIDDTPYSYAYTGRHDGGPLVPAEPSDYYGHLLSSLVEMKAALDASMKENVDHAKENATIDTIANGKQIRADEKTADATSESPCEKKPRVSSAE